MMARCDDGFNAAVMATVSNWDEHKRHGAAGVGATRCRAVETEQRQRLGEKGRASWLREKETKKERNKGRWARR